MDFIIYPRPKSIEVEEVNKSLVLAMLVTSKSRTRQNTEGAPTVWGRARRRGRGRWQRDPSVHVESEGRKGGMERERDIGEKIELEKMMLDRESEEGRWRKREELIWLMRWQNTVT